MNPFSSIFYELYVKTYVPYIFTPCIIKMAKICIVITQNALGLGAKFENDSKRGLGLRIELG